MQLKWSNGASSFNQLQILKLIRRVPGMSRAELANQTGLSKATLTAIVTSLLQEGVLRECGTGDQTRVGRQPVQLALNPHHRLAIGIELSGSECIATLTDLIGDPITTVRYVVEDSSVPSTIGAVTLAVHDLMTGHEAERLLGLGVGVAGLVDLDRQEVIQAVNAGWCGVPLGSLLSERLCMPVEVVARQNAGALGEYWHGIGKGKHSLLYVSLGVGIGSGLVLSGELYTGVSGSAGEIGHLTIDPKGERCKCGNHGCLETIASYPAIAARAREKAKDTGGQHSLVVDWAEGYVEAITGPMVLGAAAQGDQLALDVMQESAIGVGIALAGFINLFNPAVIVIGGELVSLGDLFMEPLRETVRRRALSTPNRAVEIIYSSLGNLAAPIGAATLVLDHFFSFASLGDHVRIVDGMGHRYLRVPQTTQATLIS